MPNPLKWIKQRRAPSPASASVSSSLSPQPGQSDGQAKEQSETRQDGTSQTSDQTTMDPRPPNSEVVGSGTIEENPVVDSIGEDSSYGIKVVYNPPSADLDIVFVHGLTGSAFGTWFHKSTGVHWPRDLIKQDMPNTRVMTFGYDVDVARWWQHTAQDGISGYANDLLGKLARKRQSVGQRKLIFVAHSLGGLVAQKAIYLSRESRFPHIYAIEASTVGICFLGTPHHGAGLADWGAILAKIVNVAKPANVAPVSVLKRDSEILRDIQDSFHNVLEKRKEERVNIGLVCFYETLPYIRFLIVPKESAVISGELNYPIHANHIDMTKFSDRAAPGYEDVVGEIQRLAIVHSIRPVEPGLADGGRLTQSAPATESHKQSDQIRIPSNQTKQPYYYIPLQRNNHFVGRKDELQAVKKKLFVVGTCSKVAIVGLGGVGKTQIALELAYQVKESFPECSIFWVPSVSVETLEQAYKEIATLLRIPGYNDPTEDIKQKVKQTLSTESAGQWLFIVDNADNLNMLSASETGASGLSNYFPDSTLGSIVYTTRTHDVALYLADEIVSMERMSPTTAKELLRTTISRPDALGDDQQTTELLDELECLPLAITQAAAYLNRNRISISAYLGLLKDTEKERIAILSRNFEDKTRYSGSRNAIAATWIVSFNQIHASDQDAADYLAFMSCIEPRMIPQSILPPLESKERKIHALGTLQAYSFIVEREDGHSYDLHRLVHLAMRNWLQEQGLDSHWIDLGIQHFATIFPTGNNWEEREIWRQHLPHASRIASSNQAEESENCHVLYRNIGSCLNRDGRSYDAEYWLSKACSLCVAKYGNNRHETLDCEFTLGIILRDSGQYSRAIQLLEHVEQRDSILEEDHPDRLSSQHSLARAYAESGQIQEAVRLLKHVVEIRERILAEDHPDRLASQHELAGAYMENGQIQEAVRLFEHVVQIKERTLAEDHPLRLASQHELAKVYLKTERVQEAIQLLEHVVRVKAQTLKEDDLSRLISQHTLATAYLEAGRIQEAIQLLEHVVRVKAQTLKEDDLS